MKKYVVFLVSFFLIGVIAQAQAGFRLGVKAGANLSQISGQSFNSGFDLSYHLGGFAEIDLTKKWGIQPELIWSQSKTTRTIGFNSIYQNIITPGADQQIKLDYILIPILLRYNVGKMVTLNAGPQFGILINQNNNWLVNGQNAFKNGDFSMVFGGQLNLTALRIYGRYNIGLNNINNIDNKEKLTNQQIQLGVGIRL
ncbi:MAG: porin family protein [Sphingobacteriia bacterium]